MNLSIEQGELLLADSKAGDTRAPVRSKGAKALELTIIVACCLLMIAVLTPGVLADNSEGGTEFNPILDWLVAAAKGGLGKLIAMASFVGGMLAGIMKGSLWGAGIGIGFAICMYFGPDIILGLFGMTL